MITTLLVTFMLYGTPATMTQNHPTAAACETVKLKMMLKNTNNPDVTNVKMTCIVKGKK